MIAGRLLTTARCSLLAPPHVRRVAAAPATPTAAIHEGMEWISLATPQRQAARLAQSTVEARRAAKSGATREYFGGFRRWRQVRVRPGWVESSRASPLHRPREDGLARGWARPPGTHFNIQYCSSVGPLSSKANPSP